MINNTQNSTKAQNTKYKSKHTEQENKHKEKNKKHNTSNQIIRKSKRHNANSNNTTHYKLTDVQTTLL